MSGREAHERETTTTAKSNKKKNLCAVQAHVVWMHVERFFRLLQFHSDERKKLYTFEGHSFLSRSNEGMKLWWVSLLCCLKSVCFFFLQTNMCTHGCRCSFAVVRWFCCVDKVWLDTPKPNYGSLSRKWCKTRPWQSSRRDFHVANCCF